MTLTTPDTRDRRLAEVYAAIAIRHRDRATLGEQLQTVGCGQRIDHVEERDAQHLAEHELSLLGWYLNPDGQLVALPESLLVAS